MSSAEFSFPRNKSNRLFYGADYNPEQWPRPVWEEDIKLMTEAVVNVVSVAIFSWALIETAGNRWDFQWLDEVINLLHRNNISVDLATATASPPPWLTVAHPEVLPVTKNGERLLSGRWMWGRWKSEDETGAQQEMDGVDDRFVGTSRSGLWVEQKMQRSRDKVWAEGGINDYNLRSLVLLESRRSPIYVYEKSCHRQSSIVNPTHCSPP